MPANTVLITGCSSGFGKASAALFAARGWNVVRTMRNPPAERARADNTLTVRLDVEDAASIAEALLVGVQRFGRIDVVVNNAGSGLFSVFETTPDAAVRKVFETNVFGLFNVMRATLRVFQTQGGGRIVNVSSASGFVPPPLLSIYSASKQAVEGFSESVSHELASQGITVKLVEPGMVQQTDFVRNTMGASEGVPTPAAYQPFVDQVMAVMMQPQPGLATEVEVADTIYSAACDTSDQLRFVVGADAKQFARARHETSEPEYLAWVRGLYGVGRASRGP